MAWPARSPYLIVVDFFPLGHMKSRVDHIRKPEVRLYLVGAIDEAAFGIRNQLGRMQWQHPITQRLAAFMQYSGGHFEHAL